MMVHRVYPEIRSERMLHPAEFHSESHPQWDNFPLPRRVRSSTESRCESAARRKPIDTAYGLAFPRSEDSPDLSAENLIGHSTPVQTQRICGRKRETDREKDPGS